VPDEKRNPLKLLEASERLYQIKDLDALLERVLSEARSFVNADAGTLYMASGGHLYFSFVQNDTLFRGETKDKYIPSGQSLPIDKGSIAGYVAKTGEALLIDDVYHIQSKVTFGRASRARWCCAWWSWRSCATRSRPAGMPSGWAPSQSSCTPPGRPAAASLPARCTR
jgi:hypothetical protein